VKWYHGITWGVVSLDIFQVEMTLVSFKPKTLLPPSEKKRQFRAGVAAALQPCLADLHRSSPAPHRPPRRLCCSGTDQPARLCCPYASPAWSMVTHWPLCCAAAGIHPPAARRRRPSSSCPPLLTPRLVSPRRRFPTRPGASPAPPPRATQRFPPWRLPLPALCFTKVLCFTSTFYYMPDQSL
jgi:hypothetical protein